MKKFVRTPIPISLEFSFWELGRPTGVFLA